MRSVSASIFSECYFSVVCLCLVFSFNPQILFFQMLLLKSHASTIYCICKSAIKNDFPLDLSEWAPVSLSKIHYKTSFMFSTRLKLSWYNRLFIKQL